MVCGKEQTINIVAEVLGLIKRMSDAVVKGDVEKILGAKLNTTMPDEDVILVGSDYLTYLEVEALCVQFGSFYAERDAVTGLRLAGVACSYAPQQELDNTHAPQRAIAITMAEVEAYAEAELVPLIGLDRPFQKSNGVMFNNLEQGYKLLAAGKNSYLTAYLRLLRTYAPHLTPR